MKRGPTGTYETTATSGEEVRAFVPANLPPVPPLEFGAELERRHQNALLALGRLDGVTGTLPSQGYFLYAYIRKEAVLSSEIEGTQSTLSDLLLYELEGTPGVPIDDVVEVSNYVAALAHGLDRMRSNLPLSLRLIRELHGFLLRKGRGADKDPGEFRRTQNWIGGSRPGNAAFVPPPPHLLMDVLGPMEEFMHSREVPPLIKAALVHVQFETIHPFLDGNGRTGRILIPLLLIHDRVLAEPLLYLSLYLRRHRDRYYDLLNRVRIEGDWEAWLDFFLSGVEETAGDAHRVATRLLALFQADESRIQGRGRLAAGALRVFMCIRRRPLITIEETRKLTGMTFPAAARGIETLESLSIVREITGHSRNRVFAYSAHMDILNEGTTS